MKNKSGFLLAEETLKIIIAVICISFLAYFLISFYMKSSSDEKLEQAKASLEYLVEEINAGHSPVEIYNPKGWVLSSWPYEGVYPLSCDNLGWKNCLCICDDIGTTGKVINFVGGVFVDIDELEDFMKVCDKKGICLQSDFKIPNNKIKIEKPLSIKTIK